MKKFIALAVVFACSALVASEIVTYTEADLCPSGLDTDGGCTLAVPLVLNCTVHVAPFSPSPTPSSSATASSSITATSSSTSTSTPSWTPTSSHTATSSSSSSLAPSVSTTPSPPVTPTGSVSLSPSASLSSSPAPVSVSPSVVASPAAQRRAFEVAKSSATPDPVPSGGGGFPFEDPPVCAVKLVAATGLHLANSSSLSCSPLPGCELWIDLAGRLQLDAGTGLRASTVNVTARNVSVAAGAFISASGLGPLQFAGSPTRAGNGGSFGGGGGQTPCTTGDTPPRRANSFSVPVSTCCDGQGPFIAVNASVGAFSTMLSHSAWPSAYGSGGGADASAGAGGGRIAIEAEGEVTIDGSIAADGGAADASAASPATGVVYGAGSGGTVWIRGAALIGSGTVSAVGGHAPGSGESAAGGGGRVALHYRHLSASLNMFVHGGSLTPPIIAPGALACYSGAAGTIFLSAPGEDDPDGGSARYNQLRVTNGNGVAYAVTVLDVDSSSAAPRMPSTLAVSSRKAVVGSSEAAAQAGALDSDVQPLPEAPIDAVLITNAAVVASLQIRLRTVYTSMQALRLACDSRGVVGEARTRRLSWFSEQTLQARHKRRREYCAAFVDGTVAAAATASAVSDASSGTDNTAIRETASKMVAADCSLLGGDEVQDAAFGVLGVVLNSGGTLLPVVQDTRFFGAGAPGGGVEDIVRSQYLLGGLLVRGSLAANVTVEAAEIEFGNAGLAVPGSAALLLYADNITVAATCSVVFTGVFSARANNTMVMELHSAAAATATVADVHAAALQLAASTSDSEFPAEEPPRVLLSNRGRPPLRRLADPPAARAAALAHGSDHARALQPVIPLVAREIAWWAGHSLIVGASCDVRANLVEIASSNGEVSVAGRVVSELPATVMTRWCEVQDIVREGCGELRWDATASPVPPPSNYTAVLLAPRSVVVDIEGEVLGHALAACSAHIVVQNVVNATGMGCPGGSGPGAGAAASSAGGGGGHGGDGGQSVEGARGGRSYGDPNLPRLLGSGGGSAQPSGGGAGGGYVSLHAFLDVTIDDKAVVGADAEISSSSTSLPGGGGSGGAVLINTAMLAGSGAISAEGGVGRGGGGGGGGGRFSLIDVSTDPGGGGFNPDNRRLAAAAPATALLEAAHSRQWSWLLASGVLGGIGGLSAARGSAPTVDGDVIVSAPAALALDRRLRGIDQVPAPSALQMDTTHRHAIDQVSAKSALQMDTAHGHGRRLRAIAQDFSGAIHLGGGTGSPGAGGGTNGSIEAPACPPGYGGIPQCVPCGAGFWRNGTAGAAIDCAACENAPARAEYTDPLATTGTCAYVCPAGYLYPSCLTPLEELLARFGGPAGFAGAMAGLLVALLVVLLLICRRRRLRLLAELTRGDGSLGIAKLHGLSTGAAAGVPGLWSGLGAGEDAASEGQKLSLLTHADGKSPLKRPGGVTAGGYGAVVGHGAGGARFGTAAFGGAARGLGIHTALAVLGVPDGSLADVAAAEEDKHADAMASAMAEATAAGAGAGKAHDAPSLGASTSASADALLGPLPPMRASSSRESVELAMAHAAMQERELPRFAARIYLGGANTFGSPWMLPPLPPRAAAHMVHKARYAALARRLNASLAWPRWGWEEWACLFLSLVATPASVLLHKWRKRVRVLRLMHVLLAPRRSHAWLKHPRAVALQDSVRIGVSGDCALAFIDILHPPEEAIPASSSKAAFAAGIGSRGIERPLGPAGAAAAVPPQGGLRTPLALLLAGDGTLSSPCYLDPNDIAVRSVPTLPGVTRFIDSDWIDFVAEFNVRARCIAAGAAIQTAGPVLAFLRGVNLDPELLGGLRVELVRFWPCAQGSLAAGGAAADNDDDDALEVVAPANDRSKADASTAFTASSSNRRSLRNPSGDKKKSSATAGTARAAASAPVLSSLRSAALLEGPDAGAGSKPRTAKAAGAEAEAVERSFEQCLRRGSFGAHSRSTGSASGSDSDSQGAPVSSSKSKASSAKATAAAAPAWAASSKSSAMHASRAFALGFEIGGGDAGGDAKNMSNASASGPKKQASRSKPASERRRSRGSSASGSDSDAGVSDTPGVLGRRSKASVPAPAAAHVRAAVSFQSSLSGASDSFQASSAGSSSGVVPASAVSAHGAEWQWTNALRKGWKAGWRATFTSLSDDVVASGDAKLGLLITLAGDAAAAATAAAATVGAQSTAAADAGADSAAASGAASRAGASGAAASTAAAVKAASPVLSPQPQSGAGLAIPARRGSRIGSSRGLAGASAGAGLTGGTGATGSSAPRSFSRLGSPGGAGLHDGAAALTGAANGGNSSSRALITIGSAFASGGLAAAAPSSSYVDSMMEAGTGTFQLAIGADGGVAMVGSLGGAGGSDLGALGPGSSLLFGAGPAAASDAGSLAPSLLYDSGTSAPVPSGPAVGSLRAALMSPSGPGSAAASAARRSFLTPAGSSPAAAAAASATPGSGRPGSFAAAGRGISATGMSFSLHDRHGDAGLGGGGGGGHGAGMSFSLDDDSLLPGLGGLGGIGASFIEEERDFDDASTVQDAAPAVLEPPTPAVEHGSDRKKEKRKKGAAADAAPRNHSERSAGPAASSRLQSAAPAREAPSSASRARAQAPAGDHRPRSLSRMTPAQRRGSQLHEPLSAGPQQRRHDLGPVVMHERSAAGLAARLQTASAAAAGQDGLTGRLCCLPEALCDAASDVLTLATIDIGGHDDALRRRLDMSLPLPGVRIPQSSAPLDLLLDSAGPIAANTALDAVAGAALEQLQARAAAMSAARGGDAMAAMASARAGSAVGIGPGGAGTAAGDGMTPDLGWLDGGDSLAIPLSAAAAAGYSGSRSAVLSASGPVPLLRGLSRQLSIGMGGAAVRTTIAENALVAPPGASTRASRGAGLSIGRGISALWGGPSASSGGGRSTSANDNSTLFGSFEGVGATGRRRALSGDDDAPGGGADGAGGSGHTGPIFAEDVSALMRRVLLAAAGRAPALRRRILARVRQRTALTRSLSVAPGGDPGSGLALVERHPSSAGLSLGLGRSSSAASGGGPAAAAQGVGAYSPPGSGPLSPAPPALGGGSPGWEPLAPPAAAGAIKPSARFLPQDLAALLAAAERSDSSGGSGSDDSDSDGDGNGELKHDAADDVDIDVGSTAGFSLVGYATGASKRHSLARRGMKHSSGGLARLGYAVPAPASLLWSAGIACVPAGWTSCLCCRQERQQQQPNRRASVLLSAFHAQFGFDAAAAEAVTAPRQSLRGRSGLCDGRGNGAAACFSRSLFVLGRVMQRTSLPPAPGRRIGYAVTAAVHILLLLAELALTLVLVSELWCVEPPDEAGGALHAAAAAARSLAAASLADSAVPSLPPELPAAPIPVGPKAISCDYVPVSIYLTVPPGAFALPSFFGLLAVAGQSARGLRIYASWNGASVWSTAVALALVAVNIRVLGPQLLAYPLALLALKALSAQCVPLQLAAIERLRGVRGWRGLFEVRNGPVERSSRLLKAAA